MKVFAQIQITESHSVQVEASLRDAACLVKFGKATELLWKPETAADIRRGIKIDPRRMWHSDAVADSKAKRAALRAWAKLQ
jgi:hypothetical protein